MSSCRATNAKCAFGRKHTGAKSPCLTRKRKPDGRRVARRQKFLARVHAYWAGEGFYPNAE